MGVLFQTRPKLTSISNLNDIENFSLSQVGVNSTQQKVYDDPKVALDFIRAQIAIGPPSTIRFIVDNC